MTDPITGCSGCAGSGGRGCCPHHGPQARAAQPEALSDTTGLLVAKDAEIAKLRAELAEHEASFSLRWNADQCAIKRWQDATGRKEALPDHTDLCVWLLEQTDSLREEMQDNTAAINLAADQRDAALKRVERLDSALMRFAEIPTCGLESDIARLKAAVEARERQAKVDLK